MRFLFSALISLFSLFTFQISSEPFFPENSRLHLIIDAGSSGTRFCMYQVDKIQNSCKSYNIYGNSSMCKNVRSLDGIASLPIPDALKVLDRGFEIVARSFPLHQIHKVTFIGTGGFRALKENELKEYTSKIDKYFLDKNLNHSIHVISGEEEAELSLDSIQQIAIQNDKIGMFEIGGSSIQIAYTNKEESQNLIVKFTETIGINASYEQMIASKEYHGECQHPVKSLDDEKAGDAYSKCKSILQKTVFDPSSLKAFINQNNDFSKIKFYGLGGTWSAIFNKNKKEALTLDEIQKSAREYCNLSAEQVAEKGIPQRFAGKQCFSFVYQESLLELLQIKTVYNSNSESYTRGASSSGKFFDFCKQEIGIKK